MTDQHIELLSERLRPRSLQELTLAQSSIDSLQRMVESKSVMNMLFYGKAGTGKTSAARILIEQIDAEILPLNGSHNHGDKTMVHEIENFSSSASLYSQPKVVFIDEADGLTKEVQASLRHVIEKFSERVRFLMTANDERKLSDAIKSRCIPICFDPRFGEVEQIVERLGQRYERVLHECGASFEAEKIRKIIASRFPDMRGIANALQFEFL